MPQLLLQCLKGLLWTLLVLPCSRQHTASESLCVSEKSAHTAWVRTLQRSQARKSGRHSTHLLSQWSLLSPQQRPAEA